VKVFLASALMLGCSSSAEPAGKPIVAGRSIGAVTLGMSYGEVEARLGKAEALPSSRVFFARYKSAGLEIVFTSPEANVLTPDAKVLGLTAVDFAGFSGTPRPGQRREDIEAQLGKATETIGKIDYWSSGVSVEWANGDRGEVAFKVGVFAPYTLAPKPPEMAPARSKS
jgi:hypothetical protein